MPICAKILPCAPATIAAWLLCFTTASASSSSESWWRFSACRGRSWRSIGTSLRPARTSAARSARPAAFMSRHVVDCGPCNRPEPSLFRAGSEPANLLRNLSLKHCVRRTLAAHVWSPFVPEPSFLRPPACSMASAPPPTGVTRKSWLPGFRRFASTPAFCTWMKAAF